MVLVGAALLPNPGRVLLDRSGGRPLNPYDVALLVLTAVVLLGLLVARTRRRS